MKIITLSIILFSSLAAKLLEAQTIINVNEEDTIHFTHPDNFLARTAIRKNAFKDGSYIFYSDSAAKQILFKGTISNGLTNGFYYSYEQNIPLLKMVNGEPDSVCKPDRYYLNFHEGKLQSLTVVDWTWGLNYEPRLDSVTVYFQSGKVDSVHFCYADSKEDVLQVFQKEIYTLSPKSVPLGKDTFSTRDGSFDKFEWVEILFEKTFSFNNSNDKLILHYDALRRLREVIIRSNVITSDDIKTDIYWLDTRLNLNLQGNIQYINAAIPVIVSSFIGNSNINEFRLLIDINEIHLLNNGKLAFE